MEQVEIKFNELKELIDNGAKMDELAEHYGLNMNQMKRAVKEAGLKIRKFHRKAYKIVKEEVVAPKIEEVPSELQKKVEETSAGEEMKPIVNTPSNPTINEEVYKQEKEDGQSAENFFAKEDEEAKEENNTEVKEKEEEEKPLDEKTPSFNAFWNDDVEEDANPFEKEQEVDPNPFK